ncbi:NAD-dependent dehydratase [Flavobacterium sp. 9AF]|uniref:NmrA family NAD(P)-binding protein n=1 Tax=Flavobacterium sp. 9AF TaxID=2653142 RepID=UPI0012F03F5D|nr:NmrA family NAD(P)-binding protein [Flavobacterium sp. 9AF]VXA91952.1 NAD-dependent dehydratase [Flavobacterium sp. 9AF]
MKIVITGSLGNISKPLAEELIEKGHRVVVVSSKQERVKAIEDIGATAAIGTMEDVSFLTEAYKGADIIYAMESLAYGAFFDKNLDFIDANTRIGNCHKEAIQQAGVKKVVHLSSIGAHTNKGIGILKFHYNVEKLLSELPADVSIKFMRPVGFYYNMFQFVDSIKRQGTIFSNYGGDVKEPWVSPLDIASTIAEEMDKPFEGREVRYIVSDEVSPNQIAKTLGKAIDIPNLKWETIPTEQMLNGMIAVGMNPETAKGFIEMNEARVNGILYEDYYKSKPVLGKIKLEDFAKDFANVFKKE